jgi:hypothetical protein
MRDTVMSSLIVLSDRGTNISVGKFSWHAYTRIGTNYTVFGTYSGWR